MKLRKLAFAALFASTFTLHAQQKSIMKTFPVFFGCEQFSTNDELKKCFNQGIGKSIEREIDFFSNIADYLHIKSTDAKLGFTVSKEGKFINTNVQGINPIFNSFVWSSMIIIQNKMEQMEINLKPGLDQNKNPIDVSLTIPVRFQSDVNPEVYDNFPAEERVLFTIDFEDEIIEIRMNRDHLIRTIGNNGDREFYLGKYNNLFELATVEPYATKINDSFQSGTTFITKGKIEDKEYKIQMKNFFSNNVNDAVIIEVIREENDTWAEYYEYKTKAEFNQSKFAKLTYR